MTDISPKIQPYQSHAEAMIISCYFNSQNYQSRRRNFEVFYQQLKRSNVNFLVAECAFGDEEFALPVDKRIIRFRSKHALWQKEALLNQLIKRLPSSCKYVFWLDADVLLANPLWITEAIADLQTNTICQPFSVAVRLDKDELESSFDVKAAAVKLNSAKLPASERKLWYSFARNYAMHSAYINSPMFDLHGHTGFAWGARREVLERVPLFDKAIAGTADHIIAHAAIGQIPSQCIEKAFTDLKTKQVIYEWSRKFQNATHKRLGCVEGELWHLWHGDLVNRQYLSRTQELGEMDFDFDDLELNDEGVYEVRDEKKGIIEWIKSYFISRDEDATGTYETKQTESYVSQTPQIYPDATNYPIEPTTYQSETSSSTSEPFGGNADFAGGGAGGSWENYS